MITSLAKIRKSGFSLALVGDSIEIKPASALTQQQRQFLKTHKAEIISELQAEQIRQTENERTVLAWLTHIGENDPVVIEDTLNRCRADQETMQYFLTRANETHTHMEPN
jgi:isochorismate synthase EntC